MTILVRMAQGVGAGFFCSLMIGLVFGLIGLREHVLTLWLSFICTYVLAGIVASRKTRKPYLTTLFAWLVLTVVNQGVVALAFGTRLTDNVMIWLIHALIGLLLSMLGAFLASYRPLKKHSKQQRRIALQK